MNNKIFILAFALFLITFVSAQNYNNPNLPRIQPPEVLVSPVNNNSINVNNSNCWQNDCSGFRNPFNQWLNTTNNATFNNLTVNGGSYFSKIGTFDLDLTDPALKWVRFTAFGGATEAANLNFGLAAFVFQAVNNFDMFFANDDLTALISIFNSGYIEFATSNGVYMRDASSRWFETNATRTHIYGNSSFGGDINNFTNNVLIGQNTTIKGLRHDWAVANGIINATGVNITSNHQTYNITANTALDTTYNNTLDRVIYLDVTFTSTAPSGATAYVTGYVNGTYRASEGQEWRGIIVDIGESVDYHHFGMYVQPSQRWSLNSSTNNGGSVALERVILTVI